MKHRNDSLSVRICELNGLNFVKTQMHLLKNLLEVGLFVFNRGTLRRKLSDKWLVQHS